MEIKSPKVVGYAINALRPENFIAGMSIFTECDSKVPSSFYVDVYIKSNGKFGFKDNTSRDLIKQVLCKLIDEAEEVE